MRVAMMAIVAVTLGFRISGRVVIVMCVAMMVMAVRMKTRGSDILYGMPVQADGRCPGELERNDEHDDQGDETTHESDCYRLLPIHQGSDRTHP